jgi:GT2 family glycosyltransferase
MDCLRHTPKRYNNHHGECRYIIEPGHPVVSLFFLQARKVLTTRIYSDMQEPLISIIILNWNGEKVIEACLNSVRKQTYKNLEIIVVDNASSDGSKKFVNKKFPEVKLIANKVNLGFDGGNNVGLKQAQGEFIMMLNNDTRLAPNCVEELKESIEKDTRFGACASKVLLDEGENLIDVAGIAVCLDGMSIGRGRLENNNKFNEKEEVFFASDCACLYRKEMIEDIRLPDEIYDEDFFAYDEETDMGWRARLAGWKCIYNPKAIVYHCHSASTSNYSPFKAFLVERNRVWVAVKNFPLSIILLGLFYTIQRYCFQAYGALFNKGAAGKFTQQARKSELIKILLKAHISAILGLPKMLRKRRLIFKKKRISNDEIFELFKRFGMSAKEISFKE